MSLASEHARILAEKLIKCEWCTHDTKFRLFCRTHEYERYACDEHVSKVRKMAEIDGHDDDNGHCAVEERHSMAGPYLFSDIVYKQNERREP